MAARQLSRREFIKSVSTVTATATLAAPLATSPHVQAAPAGTSKKSDFVSSKEGEQMATQTDGVTTLPGQGPVWNMRTPGRAITLKLQSRQTGESIMVFEEVAPAGTATTLHLHHTSDEVMCVLGGEFTFQIGDRVSAGGPGTYVFMPRGIPHAWKNSGADTGRAIFMYTPAEAGKAIEELSRVQRLVSTSDPEVAEIFRRHGWEIVGPSPF